MPTSRCHILPNFINVLCHIQSFHFYLDDTQTLGSTKRTLGTLKRHRHLALPNVLLAKKILAVGASQWSSGIHKDDGAGVLKCSRHTHVL